MFPSVPLEQVRVKGEEAVQRIGVSRHRVAPYGAPDDGQRVAVVALHDGVAEDELVLPVDRGNRVLFRELDFLWTEGTGFYPESLTGQTGSHRSFFLCVVERDKRK